MRSTVELTMDIFLCYILRTNKGRQASDISLKNTFVHWKVLNTGSYDGVLVVVVHNIPRGW